MSVIEDFTSTRSSTLGVRESLGKNYEIIDLLGNRKNKPKEKDKCGI